MCLKKNIHFRISFIKYSHSLDLCFSINVVILFVIRMLVSDLKCLYLNISIVIGLHSAVAIPNQQFKFNLKK